MELKHPQIEKWSRSKRAHCIGCGKELPIQGISLSSFIEGDYRALCNQCEKSYEQYCEDSWK